MPPRRQTSEQTAARFLALTRTRALLNKKVGKNAVRHSRRRPRLTEARMEEARRKMAATATRILHGLLRDARLGLATNISASAACIRAAQEAAPTEAEREREAYFRDLRARIEAELLRRKPR